jgi:hypothetical protein
MTRKNAIALIIERNGRLPRCGYETFVTRIGRVDYWLENSGGYVRLYTYTHP